jgi:predicted nucleotidyltransferase
MSIRDELLTQLNTNLSAHTAYSVSSELPFDSAGIPLYEKNMKTLYVDEDQQEVTQHVPVLNADKIMQTETTVNAYLVTDAKNQPSDIDTVIANVLVARTAITNIIDTNSSVETEIDDDRITYTFEYNFLKI